MSATPIEDYLDELLRRTHADPRTTRRLLDEAQDHLLTVAEELESTGLERVEAEREAVRRCGPVAGVVRGSWRRSVGTMVLEALRGAILLGGWGLVAVGVSGVVASVMNVLAGYEFVGGATVLGTGGHGVAEAAQDAVSLRLLAGAVGVVMIAGYAVLRRRAASTVVLPTGLIDALGAAAFGAATVVLVGACVAQASTGFGGHGVGFFASGAIVSLAGAAAFCARATQALIPRH